MSNNNSPDSNTTPRKRNWIITKENTKEVTWQDVEIGDYVIVDNEPWQMQSRKIIWCGCSKHCDDLECTLIQPFTGKTREHTCLLYSTQKVLIPIILYKEYEMIDIDQSSKTSTLFGEDNLSKEIEFPQDSMLAREILKLFESGQTVKVRTITILEEEEITEILE